MSSEMIITLIVFIVAAILLAANRMRPDLVALMVLVTLGLSGVVDPQKIFSGFSSSAVMTILAISFISIGLQQTGATNALGKIIYRIGGQNETFLIFLVTLASALLSLFMNNIAAVGVLLPAMMTLSRRSRVSPSRLLMPLAFGTILGGMATLLTTSNIIVSGALKDAGYTTFGLLDYFPVGGPVVVVGIIYLITLGKKLLPKGQKEGAGPTQYDFTERLIDLYQLEKNLFRITLLPTSQMTGLSIQDGHWSNTLNLNILAVLRDKESIFSPEPETILLPGDVLIAQGDLDCTKNESSELLIEPVTTNNFRVTDESHPLAEIVISPHSRVIGKTIKEIKFRDSYSLSVVGVWRGGKPIHNRYSEIALQFGDALLVQGPASQIHNLQENADLVLLEEDPDAVLLPQKGLFTILITIATLMVAALGILPVAQVILGGAVILILTGSININDAFHAIEWKAIFLISGLWPLSIALQESGLADKAVTSLLHITGSMPSLAISAIFIFVSMLLTLLMSGQVSAIVMIPLALSAAQNLGIDPRPLSMSVAMGCSLAFISPLGHPVNVMVMNPGSYTFKDYLRVGFPLTLLAFITILFGIHLFWGL